MVSVAIVEPIVEGNVGAIARVMKNFELHNLILVNPKCNHLSKESLDRSSHAKNILKKTKIINSFDVLIKDFDYVIGTSSIKSTDYNIARTSIKIKDIASKIKNKNCVIVFGRESSGLNNNEVKKCDFIIKIDSSRRYKALNISHAAAIIFYELFTSKNKKENIKFADVKDKRALLDLVDKILLKIDFSTNGKRETQKKVWKKVLGKGFLTKRESFALFGFFKKLKKLLD